jgi:hypothetical protein
MLLTGRTPTLGKAPSMISAADAAPAFSVPTVRVFRRELVSVLAVSQTSVRVRARRFVAPLRDLIGRILGTSPKKEMVRPDASSVVALVKNAERFIEVAERFFIRVSVCDRMNRSAVLPPEKKQSVARWSDSRLPFPAGVRLADFFPESLSDGTRRQRHGTNITHSLPICLTFLPRMWVVGG